MEELPLAERLARLTGAARREEAPFVGPDRGEAIYRACLGAHQILEARPDGHKVLAAREPPAPDYREIWTRLNRKWREARSR
ncbi:MAG: hypothetical protein OXI55_16885 [Gammaproteobacteria bacterium]|nr:hypothetical protein [Gammaproteobacteria bacterium]